MARRKKSKGLTLRLSSAKKRRKKKVDRRKSLISILIVSVIISVLAAIAIGFIFLDKYVQKVVPVAEEEGPLKLMNVPSWVNDKLKQKIYVAASGGGEDFKLDEDAAESVQRNLSEYVPWLHDIQVQTTHESLLIEAQWRKPLVLVKKGFRQYYLDAEMIVLDFIPISDLPIVEIKGLSYISKMPPYGTVWHREDVTAAVNIIDRMDKMDALVTPDKPLLFEIESINISNFDGRRNSRKPHIVLYTKDDTQIIWGARLKIWQQHLEATDEEKLAKLYSHYEEYGSLLGNVKYINLRDPQDNVSLPVDKY